MGTSERRMAIMKLLCRRRHETVSNIAEEFGVSERTIRRDIDILSLTEPIYTQSGRYGGGIYVMENYNVDRMYFNDAEAKVFLKILAIAQEKDICVLSREESATLKKMANEYIKPTVEVS